MAISQLNCCFRLKLLAQSPLLCVMVGYDLYQSIVNINNTNNHVKPPLPVCAGRRFVTLATLVTPADRWCDV